MEEIINTNAGAVELSFNIGKALLENGAEISRVQDTMERVASALETESFNAYVLTNGIFVSGKEAGNSRTFEIKHVRNSSIHLGRISAINQLSREIVAGEYSISEATAELERISAIGVARLPFLMLACATASASFCLIFGGAAIDAVVAFISGLVLEAFLHLLNSHNASKFITNLIASAAVSLICSLFFLAGVGENLDIIIIGSILRLVPGVALTNSIRDFFNGDYLSGSIRMIDAFLIGACLAIGVGTVIKVLSMVVGGALL